MREEEKQKSVHPLRSKWYKKKRWVYPAVYLGFAAIVLAAVLWYQSGIDTNVEGEPESSGHPISENPDQDSVPVTETKEVFEAPVADDVVVNVKAKFYDNEASAEDQQAALVSYNNTYWQNTGIDYVTESGDSFDVTASLSGNILKAEKDALLGYVVTIEHANGVVTHYSSLNDVQVEEGATVQQGEVLGSAGMNVFNKDAGVHAHFEIRKDGKPVNPEDFFGELVTAIPDQTNSNEEKASTEENDANEQTSEQDADENVEEQGSDEESSTDEADEQPTEDSGFEDEDEQKDASISMAAI
jgi:stage II sporulation protein Q